MYYVSSIFFLEIKKNILEEIFFSCQKNLDPLLSLAIYISYVKNLFVLDLLFAR